MFIMLTATSTPFLILSDRVSHLYDAFGWAVTSFSLTVGGIGISVAITIIVISYILNQNNKKMISEELSMFKKNMDSSTVKIIDERALTFELFVKDQVETVRDQMEIQKNRVEADVARSFAMQCEDKGLYSTALGWWLSSAVLFDLLNERELLFSALTRSKSCIENIKKEDTDRATFTARLNINIDYLAKLKLNNSIQAKILEDLIIDKAKVL